MTIKEFRQAQGLSQPKLAEALGIGVSTVGGYEAGRINPSEKVIAKIKEIFGVDLTAAAPKQKKAAPAKKAPAKKEAAPKAEAKKAAPAKKEAAKPVKRADAKKPVRAAAKKPAAAPDVIIQSPMGGEITAADILAKVGAVDKVYVRVDQNAAYWVKGEESGAVNLW